jgi:hypothetical protein
MRWSKARLSAGGGLPRLEICALGGTLSDPRGLMRRISGRELKIAPPAARYPADASAGWRDHAQLIACEDRFAG